MAAKDVEAILQNILSDARFRKAFLSDPDSVLSKYGNLTPKERTAIKQLDVQEFINATKALGDMSKASIGSLFIKD